MAQIYGITRIDNLNSRTFGWVVALQRQRKRYRRLFSDGVYGGRRKALSAAKKYRDEVVSLYRPFTAQEHAAIRKKTITVV